MSATTDVYSMPLAAASDRTGLSVRELQVAIRDGDLAVRYRGRKPLVRPEDLQEFVNSLPTSREPS